MWITPGRRTVHCPVAEIRAVLQRQADDVEVAKAVLPIDPTVRPITAGAMLQAVASHCTSTVVCLESDAPCYVIDMQAWADPPHDHHLWLAIFEYSPLYALIREHHKHAQQP